MVEIIAAFWIALAITRIVVVWREYVIFYRTFRTLATDFLGLSMEQYRELNIGIGTAFAVVFRTLLQILIAPLALLIFRGQYFVPREMDDILQAASDIFRTLIMKDGRYAELYRQKMEEHRNAADGWYS